MKGARPAGFVEQLQRAHAFVPTKGHAEDRLRMVTDLIGNVFRMARVLVDLVHDLRTPVLGDPTGDALPRLDRHLLHAVGLAADRRTKREVARILVGEQDRSGFGVGRAHRSCEHPGEEIVELHCAGSDLGDLEEHVELPNLLFELLLGLEQLDVLADHREEKPRVLDRHRCVACQRREHRLVRDGEIPLVLVEHLYDADGSAVLVLHRHAERRARPVAGPTVPLGVEAHVLIGVLDVERLAGAGHGPREPLAWLQPDLVDLVALCDLGPELVGLLVEQVERRPVGLHHLADAVEDHLEQLTEVERRPKGRADVLQRPQLGPLAVYDVL